MGKGFMSCLPFAKLGCGTSLKKRELAVPSIRAADPFSDLKGNERTTPTRPFELNVIDVGGKPQVILRQIREDEVAFNNNTGRWRSMAGGMLGGVAGGALLVIYLTQPQTVLFHVVVTLLWALFGTTAVGVVVNEVVSGTGDRSLGTPLGLAKAVREGSVELRAVNLAMISYKQDSHVIGTIQYFSKTANELLGKRGRFREGNLFFDMDSARNLRQLPEYVRTSRTLVVFLCKSYFTSPYCLLELLTATMNNIPIITVVVKDPTNRDEFKPNRLFEYKLLAKETRENDAKTTSKYGGVLTGAGTRADWEHMFDMVRSTKFLRINGSVSTKTYENEMSNILNQVKVEATKDRRVEARNFQTKYKYDPQMQERWMLLDKSLASIPEDDRGYLAYAATSKNMRDCVKEELYPDLLKKASMIK